MPRRGHQPLQPHGDMESVARRIDGGIAKQKGMEMTEDDNEHGLHTNFGSFEQRLANLQMKSADLPALAAEAVAIRLAPQLRRIEQILQDLEVHQHLRQSESGLNHSNPQLVPKAAPAEERPSGKLGAVLPTRSLEESPEGGLPKADKQALENASEASRSHEVRREMTSASQGSKARRERPRASQAKPTLCSCGSPFSQDADFCLHCGRARSLPQGRDARSARNVTNHHHLEEEVTSCTWPEEPLRNSAYAECVLSAAVERFFFVAIMVNVISSVERANRLASTLHEDISSADVIIESVCIGVFTIELMLKMSVHRLYFFVNQDMWWNLFDFLIVVISLLEQLLLLVGTGGISITFARVYRVIRACKVLRVVRAFRFLSDLRVMAACVMGSLMPLFWCCVLLGIVTLIFSMCFMQFVTEHRMSDPGICVTEPGYCEGVESSFSSVQAAMLTLFMATTGGQDWGDVYWLMGHSGLLPQLLFILFVAFFTFAFFNIVTAIFLDRAMQKATPDREEQMLQKKRDDHKAAIELKGLILSMDKESTGIITEAEIIQFQNDQGILDSLELAGLNIMDMHQFFDTLCKTSGAIELDIDTFVEAAFQMKGVASAVDVQTLLFTMQDVHQSLRRMETDIAKRFEDHDQAALSTIRAKRDLAGSPMELTSGKHAVNLDL